MFGLKLSRSRVVRTREESTGKLGFGSDRFLNRVTSPKLEIITFEAARTEFGPMPESLDRDPG